MSFPDIGTRITISGRQGEFLLVHIDVFTRLAAVVSLTGKRVLEEGIPVADLQHMNGGKTDATDLI